jgi:YVTN family beta-propeller protein
MSILSLRHRLVRARRATRLALWLGAAVAVALLAPQPIYADGGAPNLAYVAGAGANGGDLVVIDISQRRVTGRIHLGGDPTGVALSADGGLAYVTQAAAGRVAIVDTHGQRVVATIPVGVGPAALALVQSSRGSELYVANSGGDMVAVVDPDARRVVATIPVGKRPMGLAVAGPDSGISDPNDVEVYVANADGDSVSVITVTLRQVVATIPVSGGPIGVIVPATGGVAYVGTRAGAIAALDLADHRPLGTVVQLQTGAPGTMDYDAVTGQIYVPDATMGVVDTLTPVALGSEGAAPQFPREPARAIAIGGSPAAVAITFDGAYGFVAERDTGRVAMLDVGTHHVLGAVAVGGSPRAVITGPYPPAVSGLTGFIVDLLVVVFLLLMMSWGIISGRRSRMKRPKTEEG